MTRDLKLIRKQFRITKSEDKLIKKRMAEENIASFSDYLRKYLLNGEQNSRSIDQWFSLWNSQKLEQISRDIHGLL